MWVASGGLVGGGSLGLLPLTRAERRDRSDVDTAGEVAFGCGSGA